MQTFKVTDPSTVKLIFKPKTQALLGINSARPEVRVTIEFHGGAYPPCHAPLVRPHDDHHYFTADRPAGTDGFYFDRRGRVFAPILMQFEARGVL